jgi:hypothetical protein
MTISSVDLALRRSIRSFVPRGNKPTAQPSRIVQQPCSSFGSASVIVAAWTFVSGLANFARVRGPVSAGGEGSGLL